MTTEYQRGYLDGYHETQKPSEKTRAQSESERLLFAEALGEKYDPENEGDYWLGYWHGRAHQSNKKPADGAVSRGEIPKGL